MLWKWRRTPPPEETIRQVAEEVYQTRRLLNRSGDAQSDWETAEKITQSLLRKTLFVTHRPLIKLEKQVWEPLLAWADNQALLSLLGIIGNAGIILAVFTFIGTEKQRRDAEILNAWQTITSAYGQSGSGGRIQALEFLNASPVNSEPYYRYPGAHWRRRAICLWFCTWSPERLDGLALTTSEDDEGVYLAGVQLPNASLRKANFQNANLRYAYFSDADLTEATLKGADLIRANFEGATLTGANFEGATLTGVKLSEARLCRTILPEGIILDPNRDCEELGIDPETGEWIGP